MPAQEYPDQYCPDCGHSRGSIFIDSQNKHSRFVCQLCGYRGHTNEVIKLVLREVGVNFQSIKFDYKHKLIKIVPYRYQEEHFPKGLEAVKEKYLQKITVFRVFFVFTQMMAFHQCPFCDRTNFENNSGIFTCPDHFSIPGISLLLGLLNGNPRFEICPTDDSNGQDRYFVVYFSATGQIVGRITHRLYKAKQVIIVSQSNPSNPVAYAEFQDFCLTSDLKNNFEVILKKED